LELVIQAEEDEFNVMHFLCIWKCKLNSNPTFFLQQAKWSRLEFLLEKVPEQEVLEGKPPGDVLQSEKESGSELLFSHHPISQNIGVLFFLPVFTWER
jgi:hypothetical protein